MLRQGKIKFLSARILTAALAAGLLFTASPAVQARQSSTDSEWSNWKPLSKGYAARRRVPAKIDQPVEERRLANVQERLLKVKQLQERVAAREVTGDKGVTRQQKRLVKLDARLKRLAKKEKRLLRRNHRTTPSLWFRTGTAGLYSVSIDDLATDLGVPAAKITRKARRGRMELTNGGHPASWYYDSATDSILFPAETFETFYTDQNAFHFKLGRSRMSQAMPVIDGAPGAGPAEAAPFTESLTFEEEPDFFYSTWTVAAEQDADYWFWDYLYGGYKDLIEVSLEIPDPAPYGTAHIQVTMRGWTDLEPGDEHQVYAELNGQPVGTMITWDGFAEAQLVADFDQSLLNEDGNNTLTLRNSYAPGTHPGQWLDQIDLEYTRMPVAVNNTLWMHDVEGGTQIVTGFTGDEILVVQAPAGSAAMLGDVQVESNGAGQWSVAFNAVQGTDYLVVERSMTSLAAISTDNAARLAKRKNRADYLIIAPRTFAGSAEALARYQENRFEDVKIAWLDDIYNEFSDGRVDPTAIGRFMKKTAGWRVSPSYVILVGKGSLDEKNRMGYSDSFLPVLMTSTPWALAASDDRLLGVEGDAPFAIGRIPITNDDEGIAYVNKLITHEAAAPSEELLTAVLVADNPDKAGDFHLNSDLLADWLQDGLGFTQVMKLYHPDDDVRAGLTLSETWNSGLVNYDGHGAVQRIGDYRENFINAGDAAGLQNTMYPLFSALSCAVGDDTLPGTRSLVGALVLNESGGAIASLAPTGLSLDGDAQTLANAFVDTLYGAGSIPVGEALLEAKQQADDTISDFMPHIYEIVGDPSVYVR